METNTAAKTAKVSVISIWSKLDGLEGRLHGRDKNVEYGVEVPAGATPTETLERAFILTNQDDRPMGRRACSTSAGDILVLDGQHYLVQGCGFKALTPAQSAQVQALTSRDTSFGFDYLVGQNLVTA